MLISHAHKFILLSPWKSASSTCHESLGFYNDSPYDRFFKFNPFLNRVVHQHLTLAEVLALPEGQLRYKLGCFVRNPYDRAYSGFLQIQRDFADQPKVHFDQPWIGELVRTQITENMKWIIQSGFDFDEWIRILPEYEIFEVGRNSNMVLHPAHYWTHVNGKQGVDFIGKVESFSSDFSRFCEFVGIETPELVSVNVSFDRPLHEDTGRSVYAPKMSRRSLDRVYELFRDDFELFQYEII